MAKRKKPDFETPAEMEERQMLEKIANHANRSEKTSWNRKKKNMERLIIEELSPIEEQILDLQAQKGPIIDEINMYRKAMVDTCIHPFEMLLSKEAGYVECKFCGKKLKVNG